MRTILEKDLRSALIKNGLPKELADWAHSIDNKYSAFVANAAFLKNQSYINDRKRYVDAEEYTALVPRIRRVITDLFKNPVKPILPISPNHMSLEQGLQYLEQLDYMKDWFNNPTRDNVENPTKLTWVEALTASEQYHEDQASKAGSRSLTTKNDQEIILTFPDGFYWLHLGQASCRDEADAMGHCGSATNGTLYSLRDREGYPYISAAIDADNETSEQIYGRANTNPKEKYHKKILQLLGKLNIQKVGIKNYKEISLDVEDDVEDELKEWFEEEFGYYPTKGGLTDKEKKEAEELLKELNEDLNFISVDVDFHVSSDEYISGTAYASIDISSYGVRAEIPKTVVNYDEFKIELGEMGSNFPGRDTTVGLYGYNGKHSVTFYSTLGDYDVEGNSGSIADHYDPVSSVIEWIEAMVDETKYFSNNAASYMPELLDILYENGVLEHKPLINEVIDYTEDKSRFVYSDDGTFFVRIEIPTHKANGDALRMIEDAEFGEKALNELNEIRAIDTFGLRRGGEASEQLSFKDFFNDLEEAKTVEDNKTLFTVSLHGRAVMVSTGDFMTLSPIQQKECFNIIKFFDKNWDILVRYLGNLLGMNGDSAREQTLQTARHMDKFVK